MWFFFSSFFCLQNILQFLNAERIIVIFFPGIINSNLYQIFLPRRNPSLSGQETFSQVSESGALSGDLEILKQEILAEMRREINRMKNDIIDGKICFTSELINVYIVGPTAIPL